MLSNPKQGQVVRVWYAAKYRDLMPYHGFVGVVEVVCKGRPRNHGVRLPSMPGYNSRTIVVAVPAGNLRAMDIHRSELIDVRRSGKGWIASTAEFLESKTTDSRGRQVPGAYYMIHPLAGFRTVLGVHPTREAALEAARTAIETRLMGMEPIGELIDYRDCRRTLAWHQVAAERSKGGAA